MRLLATLPFAALSLVPLAALAAEPFEYMPPGQLTPGSGSGRADETVYAPGMRFPIEEGPAFANSQVWGHGGGSGPAGGQCHENNYSYPWWDNYCETRSWDMPMCPSGIGHQGQDIRPATCDDGMWWTVAAEAGTVTSIGSYSLYVTAPNGVRYDYLHGTGHAVGVGQSVQREDRLNRVSNEFGGTPTTVHLHFNLRMDVAGFGLVYAPTYMSLVTSYQELFGLIGNGSGVVEPASSTCQAFVGWAQTGDDPEAAATVLVAFDGAYDDPGVPVVEALADRTREDLCEPLGSCDHGFEVEVPISLRDTSEHEARFYVLGDDGSPVELEESPMAFECEPVPLTDGVRREITSPEVMAAWGFSPLWQVAWAPADVLGGLPAGEDFPAMPVLVVSDADEGQTRWLMDPGTKREVANEQVASAWGLAWDEPETWPAEILDAVPPGTPLRPTPFLATSDEGILFAIDDAQCSLDDPGCAPPPGGDEGANDETAGDETAGDDLPGGTAGGSDGTGSVPGGPAADDGGGEGCGCRSGGERGGHAAWLLAALGLGLRRRRRLRG